MCEVEKRLARILEQLPEWQQQHSSNRGASLPDQVRVTCNLWCVKICVGVDVGMGVDVGVGVGVGVGVKCVQCAGGVFVIVRNG
jgi:hypothetical protein